MGAEGEVKCEEDFVIVGTGICGFATALALHRYIQLYACVYTCN